MRNLAFSFVLFTCALWAWPLQAQATRGYQPPSKSELEQLRGESTQELREVRGGNVSRQASLTAGERSQLEALKQAFPNEWNLLCELKAGRVHVHVSWWDDWGLYLIVPGVSCTCAAVLLLLLLLLLW